MNQPIYLSTKNLIVGNWFKLLIFKASAEMENCRLGLVCLILRAVDEALTNIYFFFQITNKKKWAHDYVEVICRSKLEKD